MGCQGFEERLSSHLDGMLDATQREQVLAHLEVCDTCSARIKSMADLRARLQRLERPRVPAALAVELRVLASHERVRRLARASLPARLKHWHDTILLHFENLMRPVALPVAGGVVSALLLFGALIPTLIFRPQLTNDPPLAITAGPGDLHLELAVTGRLGDKLVNWIGETPRLEPLDAMVSSDDNVVELTIDDKGRIADFQVLQGQLTPEVITLIQFSRLTPATFFGKPTWGKTLLVLPGHRRYAATRG